MARRGPVPRRALVTVSRCSWSDTGATSALRLGRDSLGLLPALGRQRSCLMDPLYGRSSVLERALFTIQALACELVADEGYL